MSQWNTATTFSCLCRCEGYIGHVRYLLAIASSVMLVNLLGCGLGLLIVGNRVSHLPQNIWSSVEICSEHTFLLTAVLVPQELQFVVTLHLAPSTDRSANAYGAYSIMIKLLSW